MSTIALILLIACLFPVFVLLAWCSEHGFFSVGSLVVFSTAFCLWWLGLVALPVTLADWLVVGYYAAAYIGVGFVWCVFKFDRMAKQMAARYFAKKAMYISRLPGGKLEGQALHNFKLDSEHLLPPNVLDHKSRLLTWCVFWPASMVSFVLLDALKAMFDWVLEKSAVVFNKLAKRHYKGEV